MDTASLLVGMVLLVSGDSETATLRGAVVDAAGKPIAGARVDIATAAPRFGEGLFCPSCYRDCAKGTRSDNKGRFEIRGLDPTLKFTVLVSAASKKARWTKLIDPLNGDLKITLDALPANRPPEQTVQGRLMNDRGKPIAGALVYASGAQNADKRWWGQVDVDPAVSDAEGYFSLMLPRGYQGVDVTIRASEYAGIAVEQLKPGANEHRVIVPAGTQVTGRLVHEGKPMAGLRVAVVQMDRDATTHFIKAVGAVTDKDGQFRMERLPADQDYVIFTLVGEGPQKFVIANKKFKAYADRKERIDRKPDAAFVYSSAVSGPDGKFRVPVILGPGQVEIHYDVFGYYAAAVAKIDVPKSGEAAPVKLTLTRGLMIRGMVRDENGKPAASAVIRSEQVGYRQVVAKADGRFELAGLAPHEKVILRVRSPYGVAETTIAPVKDHPKDKTRWHDVEIKLKAGVTLTGRVFHGGKPRSGAVVSVYLAGKDSATWFGEGTTDAKGEYRIAGLEPGKHYFVHEIRDPDGLLFMRLATQGFSVNVPTGKTAIRLPDASLVSCQQKLRGIVVDPRGKPVASVRVSAMLANGTQLSRPSKGPPPWTETDKKGQFELRQLPDLRIKVMAHIAKGGERIRFPSYVETTLNQQDIRIVLDPTLHDGIEDLDAQKKPKKPKK